MADAPLERLALLGTQYGEYDTFHQQSLASGRTTASISAGLREQQRFKGPREHPNEDSLLVAEQGERTLLVVADAHYGPESSAEIVARMDAALARNGASLPSRPLELLELVWDTRDPVPAPRYSSETTLLVALLDRAAGAGFGVSFGDSSLVVLDPQHGARRVHRKTPSYVSPCKPMSFNPRQGVEFQFPLAPGLPVLAFTDGVDECHYRHPESSIQGHHLVQLWAGAQGSMERMVDAVVRQALAGVDGAPGGQDNVALIGTVV